MNACSVSNFILFSAASSCVYCLTNTLCSVSIENEDFTTDKCADECVQLNCTIEHDDGNPDTINWRSTGALFYYQSMELLKYNYSVTAYKNVNNVQYYNKYAMSMRANLSMGNQTFTCQCGSSKPKTTIRVLGE